VTTPKELFPPIIIAIPDPNASKPADKESPPNTGIAAQPSDKKETDDAKKIEPDATPKPKNDTANGEAPRQRVVSEMAGSTPADVPSCSVSVSEDNITLQNSGGNLAILVGIEGPGDLAALTAKSNSPTDVEISQGPQVAGLKDRVLYVLRSISAKQGIYQVVFELPCGKKEVLVKVR